MENAIPKITKINNDTLYSNNISDFFPTYLAPKGKEIIIPARKEKIRNQIKKSIDLPLVNAEKYAIKGMEHINGMTSAKALPFTIVFSFTGRCLNSHNVFSSLRKKLSEIKTEV
jgi:hypothetical protein